MRDIPKDLGRRIVEAARLAVWLHLQKMAVDGVERPVGGADLSDGATDAPALAALAASSTAEREAA